MVNTKSTPQKKPFRLRHYLRRRIYRALDPFYSGKRKRVVMIHNGRCGSTVLARLLDDHPDMYWEGELFKSTRIKKHERDYGRFSFLQVLRSYESLAKKRAFGFEMKFIHMEQLGYSQEEFLKIMKTQKYHYVILLTRQNLLRREVSSGVAREVGKFHFKPGQETHIHQISLAADQIINQLDRYRDHRVQMEALLKDTSHLVLTYEDDIKDDPRRAYAKACTYLGLQPIEISPRLKPSTPYPLKDILINYEEIKGVLKNTEYAWMLEE